MRTVWQRLADWANLAEGDTWQELLQEMRTFATGIRLKIWGTSPLVLEPLWPAA